MKIIVGLGILLSMVCHAKSSEVIANKSQIQTESKTIQERPMRIYDEFDRDKPEYWLQFLLGEPCRHAYHEVQFNEKCRKELKFAYTYFEPIYTDGSIQKNGKLKNFCYDSDGEKNCDYKIKKPIRFKGTLTLKRNYQEGACSAFESIHFKPNDKTLPEFLQQGFIVEIKPDEKIYNTFLPTIPQWFREYLAGEITYEVSFTLKDIFQVDYSACSMGNRGEIENLQIIRKISSKPYDRDNYMDVPEYNFALTLESKESYVNLRESPNGKILTQIEMNEFDKILLWNLDFDIIKEQYSWLGEIFTWQKLIDAKNTQDKDFNKDSKKSQWVKVLYFPPNVNDVSKAMIGYIHHSQIKGYEK
ncbi:hypothetical protein CQA53_03375 [Helicobacter didelphidarum]|uniref:YARHG domain-containing protein n=1 Tax=Helicobacter didelphidarum TaxID=2040648 RepID=A0A3D8IMM3_9HELI|nr:hypothetical protein [Helicobacter didelphidarum]RDU66499.1 hypothetical protein CQA53_03375 [Helicobacter didelphidarum]